MTAKLNLTELPPEVASQIAQQAGISTSPRAKTNIFPINRVRTEAIKVLAVMPNLSPDQRKRVLKHALKMNEV